VERLEQHWRSRLQLLAVLLRELFQHGFSFGRDLDQHSSAVLAVVVTLHESARHGPIDELDGAVVLDQQPLGEVADGWRAVSAAEAAQHEQQLMLLWFEAERVRSAFAKGEEAPELEAEASEGSVVEWGENGRAVWQTPELYRVTI
jgi:hypothetical protein